MRIARAINRQLAGKKTAGKKMKPLQIPRPGEKKKRKKTTVRDLFGVFGGGKS